MHFCLKVILCALFVDLVFSSFYNAPVQIIVERCDRRTIENGELLPMWDRVVHLVVHDEVCAPFIE